MISKCFGTCFHSLHVLLPGDAGGMARMCLRLHRPFRREADDPVHLDDAAAVVQLHEFAESPTCPVWLKKRYAKHNRLSSKRTNKAEVTENTDLSPADAPGVPLRAAGDVAAQVSFLSPADVSGVPLRAAGGVAAQVSLPSSLSCGAGVSGMPLRAAGVVTAPVSAPSASSSNAIEVVTRRPVVINLSGPRDSVPEPSDDEAPSAQATKKHDDQLLPDTLSHRQAIANQHGLLWGSIPGDSRHSIVDAVRNQRPPLKLVSVKGYLAAITDGKMPTGKQVHGLVQQFVFHMLFIDLQPYERRGAGVFKPCLSKPKLKNLVEAFFQSKGSSVTSKEKRNVMMKPYAELWEFVKLETLKQCGLAVSSSPSHRVGFQGQPVNTQSTLRDGTWRQQVFCLDPFSLEHEEWEDSAEREAKRIRYVQAAMHEQSMGRPSKKQYEVSLPIDTDALTCADFDTRSEWDALHPYVKYVSTQWLSPEIRDKLLPETKSYVLKPSQGGLAHVEAEELTASAGMSLRTTGVTTEKLDQNSSMSLRTARVTAERTDQNSSMSLRTASVTPQQTEQHPSMSLRTARVTAEQTVRNTSMSLRTAGLTTEGPALDPTQASFVQHMSSWKDAYKSEAQFFKANLPMPQKSDDPQHLTEPVLLLGTAGTGKTTTLQAANRLLETHGLKGRIVRWSQRSHGLKGPRRYSQHGPRT